MSLSASLDTSGSDRPVYPAKVSAFPRVPDLFLSFFCRHKLRAGLDGGRGSREILAIRRVEGGGDWPQTLQYQIQVIFTVLAPFRLSDLVSDLGKVHVESWRRQEDTR